MDKQKKRRVLVVGIVLMIALAAIPLINLQSSGRKLNALLDLGEKYLEDLQYESAIAVFDEAIAIDPKCAEAYLGKAKAQYALKLYQDAIDTLQEGIERVDDSTELEAFLQQILNEIAANNKDASKTESSKTEIVAKKINTPVVLNYTRIVRSTETDDPTIQLEVLGDNDGKYIWESNNPECVTVSDTGLVTCLPVAGYASIIVTAEEGRDKGDGYRDQCAIRIYDPNQSYETESDCVRIAINDEVESQKQYMGVELSEDEDGWTAEIIKNVYYSGDVLIPEHLTYHNETVPITTISDYAFYWSYEMKSVFIPAFVESVEGYYNRNPFAFCLDLEKITVDEENAFFQVIDGVLYSKDGKQLISYPAAKSNRTYTIPGEVEVVYPEAFVGCRNLEEILVEDGNQYYEVIDGALIDKKANTLIAYPIGNKASSYTVPENVTYIASGAFYGSRLEEVVCRSVEQIYSDTFLECNNLKKIECGQGTKSISMSVYDDDNNSIEIAGFDAMENLEELSISLSETQDISEFAALQKLEWLSLNINGRALDLQVLRGLTNLTDLQIRGMDNVKDISWLGDMECLESIALISKNHLDEDIDFKELEKLKNVETLDIWGIRTLADISWLAGMEKLRTLRLDMEKSEIKDLSLLLELDNLYHVLMQSQEDVTDETIKRQIEEIKSERPDVDFNIFE